MKLNLKKFDNINKINLYENRKIFIYILFEKRLFKKIVTIKLILKLLSYYILIHKCIEINLTSIFNSWMNII